MTTGCYVNSRRKCEDEERRRDLNNNDLMALHHKVSQITCDTGIEMNHVNVCLEVHGHQEEGKKGARSWNKGGITDWNNFSIFILGQ